MLGTKCQQQVNLLKESFAKYEKVQRSLKEIRAEKENIEKQKKNVEETFALFQTQSQNNDHRKQQYETMARKLEAERFKIDATLK